eukprot:13578381-Heterocapsa_arctica.AAC.1
MKEISVWNQALKEDVWGVVRRTTRFTATRLSIEGHENIGMKIYAGCELIKDNIGLEEYFG